MKKALITIISFFTLSILAGCHSDGFDSDFAPRALQSMTVATDMSNQRVSAFAEDSLGRIWVGTFRGLNRYNGNNYHQFICTDSIIDLPDNQINDLFNDSHNRLWVATINGVAIYDDNNHFKRVPASNKNSYNAQQIIESTGRDSKVYINYNTHLDVYDEDSCRLLTVIDNLNPDNARAVYCHFDRRNKLWTISPGTLRCYESDDYTLIDSLRLPSAINTHYMDSENDYLWLGGDRYLAAYDLRNHKMAEVPADLADNQVVRQANITNIHPYEGGYWLLNTSNKGVLVYNINSGKLWQEGDNGYPFDLPHFRLTCFYTDKHKNLWVGSYDHGCTVINKYKKQFNSNTALHTFVNERSITSIDSDNDGNIWMVAGYDGLLVYNSITGEAHTFDAHIFSGKDATNASLSFVKVAKDSQIWIASLMENKVWRCRWSNGTLHIQKEYSLPKPLTIVEDDQHGLWIGTGGEWLARYNPATDSFVEAKVPKSSEKICFITDMAPVGDKLYVSVFGRQLMEANWHNGTLSIDTLNIDEMPKLITRSRFIPTDMFYDSYGLLWVGTVGNGLLQHNPEDGSVSRIEGLPCTDISSLEEDRQGHMWISSQYGLARYDRTTGRIKTFFANDGIGGNQFYDRASTILPDGTLVFGGSHGITEFNPLDVAAKRKVPLVFEDLKIHNNIVDPISRPDIISKNLDDGRQVTLGMDDNAFSISFAALDYASPEPPSYSYRLEGHDPYWIDAQHSNEAYYANLKPGNYIFKVRISDDNNSLMESEISLPIHVSGSIWLSWWAILIYLLVAILIISEICIHRRLLHQQQQRMQQMLVAMESMNNKTAEQASEEVDEKSSDDAQVQKPRDLSESDKRFLQELQELMETELANPELDVNRLTEMMHISRTKFYYKVKTLTGVNPSVFFKTYKLNRAAQLLKDGHHTIAEVADMTGFSSAAHFSTSFKKHFGQTPTLYSR